MHSLLSLCFLAAAAVIPSAVAKPVGTGNQPVIVHPGPPQDVQVTKFNTLNGTMGDNNSPRVNAPLVEQLPFSIKNNYGGGQLYAYVTGLDPSGKVVMLQPNGQWYYPTSTSSTVPQPITADVALTVGAEGSTSSWTLPTYCSSGRIYLSDGQLTFSTLKTGSGVALVQPNPFNPSDSSADKNWSFMELTNNAGGLYADVSYVDFVGLPLGISMTTSNGQTQTIQGVSANAVSSMCSGLKNYASSDGQPWDQTCQYLSNGTPLRAISPTQYIAQNSNAFASYYTNYVNQVWAKYASSPLTIDSQGSAGSFTCTTGGGSTLNCNGGNRGFTKPSSNEIFGCSGTFGQQGGDNEVVLAATARLCAAFDRTTLLLNGGNVQPSLGASNYYTTAPTNRYSQLVHQVEVGGLGYAFPYDDVTPDNAPNQSGTLASNSATSFGITVGGP